MYHKKMNVPGEQFNERCNLKPLELDLKICSLSVFLKWAIPGLFFFIFVFSIHLTVNVQYKFLADDWIRTADLWNRKRPLYQLSRHHHCPNFENFYGKYFFTFRS